MLYEHTKNAAAVRGGGGDQGFPRTSVVRAVTRLIIPYHVRVTSLGFRARARASELADYTRYPVAVARRSGGGSLVS